MANIIRLIALGASNLTRGFYTVVSSARATWGPDVQVLAAFGHGRSYGAPSRVFIRTLPGIVESGLWRALESLPQVPTRAIVTDIGNDMLYGFAARQILAWVEECLNRLQRVTRDITVTDLPLGGIQRLPQTRYLVLRSILFPFSRLPLDCAVKTAEQISAGLKELSTAFGLRLFKLDPAWYGLDCVHIQPRYWRLAWQEILCIRSTPGGVGRSLAEGLKLRLMAPERRWMFGFERFNPQFGVLLRSGGRIWLY